MEAMNRSKYELHQLFKFLNIDDKCNLVESALSYFRAQFTQRRNLYPGDDELYKLFSMCIKEGLTMDEAYKKTLLIIRRELFFIDANNAIGRKYSFNIYNRYLGF